MLRSACSAMLITLGATAATAQQANLGDRLRSFNFTMDYAGGVAEGEANAQALRNDPRARAWFVLLLARDDRKTAALALADSMMRRPGRGSPWAWFARTAALSYGYSDSGQTALAASDSMMRRAPRHPDVAWLRGATVLNRADARQAIGIADSFLAHTPDSPRLLVLRGNATVSAAFGRTTNQALRDSAWAFYARARELDSTDVLAWAAHGTRLAGAGQQQEGLALLERAVALAPHSAGVHRDFWSALRRVHAREIERARELARPGFERLLAARGSDPAVLQILRAEYQQFGMSGEQTALEERILREHPWSLAAEWVLVNRYRAAGEYRRDSVTRRDTTLRNRYRTLLAEFVARPRFVEPVMRGDAYRELFFLADSLTPPDTLLSWVIGMERWEGINTHISHAMGAIALADRGVHLAEAERLAREGVRVGRGRLDRNRSAYDGIGEWAGALDWMTSQMVDALGWVYFKSGRREDAERELRRALDLAPQNMSALHHMGRLFEMGGRPDSAEAYYIRGAMVSSPGNNPNREALRAWYRTQHGSMDGWDAYNATIRDRDRDRRRTVVMSELRSERDRMPAFELVTTGGATVRSDTLAGRVTVINFWGKWCGPCVAEMPEMQRFWRQVAADSAVRFLTINNDQNLEELGQWMRQNQYDIPILVDGGYAARSSVNLFPTTWFLDRAGRIAFVKPGYSEQLAEEFGWRVEVLKSER